jgi:predicted RNA methylase
MFSGPNPSLDAHGSSKRPVITDGTANVGGNSISFHLNGFERVQSVEIDLPTCQMLKNNLEVYHCPTDGVLCQDYLSLYRTLEQDVVFLDPPWGGRNYLKTPQLDLFLSGVNLLDICTTLIKEHRTRLLVLKLPINYTLQNLINHLPSATILIHKINRNNRHSYNVVFCWN